MAPSMLKTLRQSTLDAALSRPERKRKCSPDTKELEPPIKKSALSSRTPQSHRGIKVTEQIGDLFAAPNNSLLIHACNCQGEWGAGIAKAFRINYPIAFEKHKDYCQPYRIKNKTTDLLGTAQLIEPVDKHDDSHFIGCLFTSNKFGRAKGSPKQILEATETSMEELFRLINDWNGKHESKEQITSLYMCKINSGAFKVPWEMTKNIIENMEDDLVGVQREITVCTPEGM